MNYKFRQMHKTKMEGVKRRLFASDAQVAYVRRLLIQAERLTMEVWKRYPKLVTRVSDTTTWKTYDYNHLDNLRREDASWLIDELKRMLAENKL